MRRRSVTLLGLTGLLALPLTVMPQAQAADGLVSGGKPVTASSVETSAFGPGLAVDGSTATRWASAEGVDPQWIRIDLGANHTISRVKLNWEDAYGRTYRIQTSADGSTWTDVYSTTAGDGATDDLTVSGSGRYVRMYGTGRGTPYGYSLWEFEVYGAPTGGGGGGGPAVPFGSHLRPYTAGTLKPSGTQAALDQKVVEYYNKWEGRLRPGRTAATAGTRSSRPTPTTRTSPRRRGTAWSSPPPWRSLDSDAKKIFDGLVKWKIDHPSSVNPNLLAAEQDTACKSVNGGDGATDGDMDVAYGLLLADEQRRGSAGAYNYKDLALKHIAAIKKDEVNPTTKLLKLGDWSGSGDQYYYISRTSDWMADHFRAFRAASGDTTWDAVRGAHQTQISRLQSTYASGTGLLPDFVVDTNTTPRPAPGQVLEHPERRRLLVERLPHAVAHRRRRRDQRRRHLSRRRPEAQRLDQDEDRRRPEQDRRRLQAQRHPDLLGQRGRLLRPVRGGGDDRPGQPGLAGRPVEQDAGDPGRHEQLLLGQHPAPGHDHGLRQPLGSVGRLSRRTDRALSRPLSAAAVPTSGKRAPS
ncbi:hypothetical protein STANM309S_00830 [Streptomyces tanashiensis]